MAKIILTVKQIINLGLWDRVVEYKGWNPYILNEGQISEEDLVEFNDEFKKEKTSRSIGLRLEFDAYKDNGNDLSIEEFKNIMESKGLKLVDMEYEKINSKGYTIRNYDS